MKAQEVKNTIEYEDGLPGALEWGLVPEDMPDETLKEAFTKVYDSYQIFEKAADDFMGLLG